MDKKSTPSKYALQQRDSRSAGDDVLPSRLTIALIRHLHAHIITTRVSTVALAE